MISVIIPAFNEVRFIGATLSTIKKYAQGFEGIEFIVVNNGSQDRTADVISEFLDVKLLNLPTPVTVAQARNIGVENSCGDVLVFIDADIIVTQHWWNALIAFNKTVDAYTSCITGFKVAVSQSPSWIEENWFSCLKKTSSTYINSGNLICTKKVFNLVNGFDSNLRTGEDVDFCVRAKKHNVAIIPDESFFVHHEGYPKTLNDFFRREKWHGIGDFQTLSKFCTSKVAHLSVLLVGLTVVMILLFCLKLFLFASLVLFVIVVINFFTLIMRLKVHSLIQFFKSFFLNYIYFIARFFSLAHLFNFNSRSR